MTASLNSNCKEVQRDEGWRLMKKTTSFKNKGCHECIHEQTEMEPKNFVCVTFEDVTEVTREGVLFSCKADTEKASQVDSQNCVWDTV